MGDRRIEYVRLDAIPEAPRNPKAHDADGIAAAITEFAFGEAPLLDERTGRLVAGHGRLHALAALHAAGQPTPDGIRADTDGMWLAPVIRGWESRDDRHAEAYLLASNKLTANGAWDDAALDAILADLAAADLDLAVTAGFAPGELEALLAAAEEPYAELDAVPATNAEYAETAEEEAARRERIGAYGNRLNPDQPASDPADTPGAAPGGPTGGEPGTPDTAPPGDAPRPAPAGALTELPLVYTPDDRAEVARHLRAARDTLGPALKTGEIVLRALRVLTHILDAKDDPTPVDCAYLAKHAGWAADE